MLVNKYLGVVLGASRLEYILVVRWCDALTLSCTEEKVGLVVESGYNSIESSRSVL